MPTEKRQRQKAGRQARLEAEQKAAKRRKSVRRGITLAVLVAIVVGITVLLNSGSNKSSASTTSTTSATSSSSATATAQATADKAAVAAGCPSSPTTKLTKPSWKTPPAMTIDTSKTYTATVNTDVGTFTVALDAKAAPHTVNNFVFLANQKFYNCVIFHRVIPGFMDQTGDPTGTGTGGPGYQFADELPKTASPQYPIGSVAMANSGPNTNGSQFFIVTGSQGESLPPSYSLFGTVTSGMPVVQKINADGSTANNGVPPKVIHRMLSVTVSSS